MTSLSVEQDHPMSVITPRQTLQLLALYSRFDDQKAVGGRSRRARTTMREALAGIYASEPVDYYIHLGITLRLDYFPLPGRKDRYSMQVHAFTATGVDVGHVSNILVLPDDILFIEIRGGYIELCVKVRGLTKYVNRFLEWRTAGKGLTEEDIDKIVKECICLDKTRSRNPKRKEESQ